MFILIISIGAISAADNSNLINSEIQNEDFDDSLGILDYNNENIAEYSNEAVVSDSSSGKTIVVVNETNSNQVSNPTVQHAIDQANSGDTIILNGDFVNCHFTINKTLTVLGDSGSSLDSCPTQKHDGVDEFGVFYINDGGNGSVIKGFTFTNNDKSVAPFSFLIRGASNIEISDCTIDFSNPEIDKITGIIIENSNNVTLSNLVLNNTIYGIRIINSTNVNVVNCTLMNGENYGVSVSGDSKNVTILSSTIMNNAYSGINLTSADNVNIISNFIKNNGLADNTESGSGIYVNTNITKLIVKGNIFLSNALHAILYDYRARNLDNSEGADELTIVDNNYFAGHSSMILHHRTYIPHENGDMEYDAVNDVFVDVGLGSYIEAKTYFYMRHAFVCEGEIVCGFTYYTPTIPWTLNAGGNNGQYNLSLTLGNINQIKKGVYEVSIVDDKGNVAADFGSFNVTFYLSNNFNVDDDKLGISRVVKIQNGTATVDFRDLADKYSRGGNFITASFPGMFSSVKGNPYAQLFVDDSNIPDLIIPTQINISNANIVYGSHKFVAALSDVNNNALSGKPISVLVNGKQFDEVTDGDGQIKLPVSSCGNYDVTFIFNGDDEYDKSSAIGKIVISKATPKLTYAKLTTYPISDAYFKVKLTDSNENPVYNQKITFKINGKQNTVKTDKNGIAKVKVSLTTLKSYNVAISYSGSSNLKSVTKTGKIVVKTGSKKSKITAKNIKVKKNTKKSFSLKLVSSSGKAISKQKVIVKLNGKAYTLKTNSKGIAKLAVKLSSVKKYKVSMKFLGNSNFKATSKTSIITVTKK